MTTRCASSTAPPAPPPRHPPRHRRDDEGAHRVGARPAALDDSGLLRKHHRGVPGGARRLVRVRAVGKARPKDLTVGPVSKRPLRRASPLKGGGREAARQETTVELRRGIRMLGDVLGQVVSEYGGAALLRDVEQLRRAVIQARDDANYERRAEALVASWSLSRATAVARAFACY